MLLPIIIVVSLLIVIVYVRHETVSPKLVVREAATLTGNIVGATPKTVQAGIQAVKLANAASESALRATGSQGPVGYRAGRIAGNKFAGEMFDNSIAASKLSRAIYDAENLGFIAETDEEKATAKSKLEEATKALATFEAELKTKKA